ncbi:MAG: hypothetical protein OEY67_00825 [Gammaproteobacteria bacterium]|nr:hypothetical protein [Gammaproteobacteria bacterium]
MKTRYLFLFLGLVMSGGPVLGASDVTNTRHNLSVSGPGTVKSTTVTQICVFCHTPHAAMADAPLWNHTLPSGQTYTIYSSTTLDASPGQPTGKSVLCLACHDGTVALGALANPPTGETLDAILQSPMNPAERGYLGTDLSDDHPISFVYDSGLVGTDTELVDPASIGLPLDGSNLECTTCHDPHEADTKPFLRQSTVNGTLCTSCHNKSGWSTSSHATSTAVWNNVGANPWANRRTEWIGANVAENACLNCHTPHTAAAGARLQKYQEENTCLACHNGNTASTNIQTDLGKTDSHPVTVTPNANHDFTAKEDPLTMTIHAECPDCHNPHTVQTADPMISFNPLNLAQTTTTPPLANARIQNVRGLDINGSVISSVTNQYELCFKCHGLPAKGPCGSVVTTDRCGTATGWSMTRLDGIYNIRDKLNANNPALVSWHPIVTNNPANNSEVPSLRTDIPLNKTSSLIYCTDCHNSDASPAAGGTGPNGPHGSNNEALLAQRYSLDPIVPTSGSVDFVLCFKCHSESALLVSPLSGFSHQRHINTRTKSCVNCHDPHGSHSYNHLINFQTNSSYTGGPYVIGATGGNPQPIFQDNGNYTGACWLNCHGNAHSGRSY